MAVKDNIAEYMTSLGKRKYTAFDVSIIQRAIVYEFKDRKKTELNINFRTVNGRKMIKQRILEFANKSVGSSKYVYSDIVLYRACKENEYLTRTNKTAWWDLKGVRT